MSHQVVKFEYKKIDGEYFKLINGREDDNMSREDALTWHLISNLGDGENTACGHVYADYDRKTKTTEKGKVTCVDCLSTINYYKTIKL